MPWIPRITTRPTSVISPVSEAIAGPTKREEQIARIRALADKWLKPLGFPWWRKIEFVYYDDRSHFTTSGHCEAVMITRPSRAYLEAIVDINLALVQGSTDADLEYYFVHEMVHILTDEFEPDGDRRENIERTVTQIARAFIGVAGMLGKGE